MNRNILLFNAIMLSGNALVASAVNNSGGEENFPSEKTKPNFILIIADDLGYADISMHGSTQIPTPNIDGLAKDGINFTQAYVSAPVCSPSRAGLITGRNQVEFGYDNNISLSQPGYDPQFMGLPVTETTIASRLLSFAFSSCTNKKTEQKPNVLFIICDDLNDYEGFFNGHPQTITPNFDKLSKSATTFTNAISNYPVCLT